MSFDSTLMPVPGIPRASPDITQADGTVVPGAQPDGPNGPIGFFGGLQGATPKYAKNTGLVGDDGRNTMARMFINSPNVEARINALDPSDPFSLSVARVYTEGYVDFILSSIQGSLSEKVSVTENLADGYSAVFLGQAPSSLQCSGALINSMQDDQVVSMVRLYTEYFRGTRLAEHGETLRLRYDSWLYQGAMTNISWSLQAENEMVCPFSFTFLVKTRTPFHSKFFRPVSVSALPDNERGAVDAVGPTVTGQKVQGSAPPVKPAEPAAPAEPPSTSAAAADVEKNKAEASARTTPETARQEAAIAAVRSQPKY